MRGQHIISGLEFPSIIIVILLSTFVFVFKFKSSNLNFEQNQTIFLAFHFIFFLVFFPRQDLYAVYSEW